MVLIVPYSAGYSANSTSYKLWKSQEGYFAYNVTDEVDINSAFYKQNINTNLNNSLYKYCEGFYCLYKAIYPTITPSSGQRVEVSKILVCSGNETVVILNETYYCITPLEIKEQLGLRDLRALLTIVILLASIAYIQVRRRRNRNKKLVANIDNLNHPDTKTAKQ